MALRSNPLSASQAGNKLMSINKGKPEVNPVKKQITIFLVRKIKISFGVL